MKVPLVTPNQMDRDAVIRLSECAGLLWPEDFIRNGYKDVHAYVQAFARHRIWALESAARLMEARREQVRLLFIDDHGYYGEREAVDMSLTYAAQWCRAGQGQ